MYRLLLSQRLIYRVFRHLILFASMVLLFSWVTMARAEPPASFMHAFWVVFVNALFFFGYAYLTVYILIPGLLVRRKIFLFFLTFIVAGICLSLVKFLVSDMVFYGAISPENNAPGNLISISGVLVNTKDMTFIVALFAIAKYARDHYLVRSNIRELEQKGLEAKIKLLDHHLDPHVIFNNFNSLYSISISRPGHLAPTVKKIKSILYYLFMESREEKIQLGREIEMIENYIGLEKLRFGERLDVQVMKTGETDRLKIAPLILYSFVENCFVHGAGQDTRRPWIRIEIQTEGSRLRFLAANSVAGYAREQRDSRKKSTSENTIRRLELQYPDSHRLTIREKRYEHSVELNMTL